MSLLINCNRNNSVCRHWDGEQSVRAELRFKFVDSNVEKVKFNEKKIIQVLTKFQLKLLKVQINI